MKTTKILSALFTLIVFSSFAIAFDPGINTVTLPNTPNSAQTQTFSLNITNHEDDSNNFTINLYKGTNLIDSNTYFLTGFQTTSFSLPTNLPSGNATYDLNIYSPIDNNLFNNNYRFDLNVLRGPDPLAGKISLDKYNALPGQTIQITGTITNNGDMDLINPTKIDLFVGENQIYETIINSLLPNQNTTIQTNYSIPSDLTGSQIIRMTIDDQNTSPDADRTNNSSTTSFSVSQEPDLSINSSDINFDEPMHVGYQTQINFLVRNIGAKPVQNALIRVWHTSETTGNILYSSSNSFDAGETKTLSFYYVPQTTGTDIFYFEIDPLHDLNETSTLNNSAQKSFNVLSQGIVADTNGFFYSKNITVRGNCFALFSNNDKFITTGIQKVPVGDANSLEYCVNFSFNDAWGTQIAHKDCARANDSFNMQGRTLTVLSVNSDYANVFVVFSTPVTSSYSTCDVDVGTLTDNLSTCQSNLKDTSTKLDVCNATSGNNSQGYSSCQKNSQDLQGMLSQAQNNLVYADNNCNQRVTNEVATANATCNTNLSGMQNNLDKSDLYGFIGWILFFVSLVGFVAFEYLFHYKYK